MSMNNLKAKFLRILTAQYGNVIILVSNYSEVKMALLNVIEWANEQPNEILHKINTKDNIVKRGSALTVREGQVAVFCDKGRMADVFLPGYYKLETDTLPILTALMSWKYAFESPFKSDIYFVSTKKFVNQKWGTATPVIIRDKEYGTVRVRGYGAYSYRIVDAFVFLTELVGARNTFTEQDVTDYLRSKLVMGISDALGECNISVADMAGNLMELSEVVEKKLEQHFSKLGVELSSFVFESVSLPDEVQKALDENVRLGVLRRNVDVYTELAKADALKEAAKNPGMAGSILGAGIGLGIGSSMGKSMGESLDNTVKSGKVCQKCGSQQDINAKFCSECGTKLKIVCPSCGKELTAETKFCPECGEKIK